MEFFDDLHKEVLSYLVLVTKRVEFFDDLHKEVLSLYLGWHVPGI